MTAAATPASGKARRLPWRWILIALAVAGLVAATRLLPVAAWAKQLEAWISGLGTAGYVAFYAVYVVAVLLFVPGAALTIAGGFLFGLARGILIVSAAATTAAALAFLIARHLARGAVEARARKDRRFTAIDPEGHHWFFATHVRDVAPEEWGAEVTAASSPST